MWKQFFFYRKQELVCHPPKISARFKKNHFTFVDLVFMKVCFNQSSFVIFFKQRVLEADAAEDAFNDDDDYEVDTPKRRHRGKGRVSNLKLL